MKTNRRQIKNSNKNKKNITLYVIRLSRTNERRFANSAPCSKCTEILKKTNVVKRIVYSDENGEIISAKLRDYTTDYFTLGDRVQY
jgi:cytidine deaminase